MQDEKQAKILKKILDDFIESPNIDDFLIEMGKNFRDDYQTIREVAYFTTNYLHEKNKIDNALKKSLIKSLDDIPDDENCYPCLYMLLEYVVES